jgi:hypothetical protein
MRRFCINRIAMNNDADFRPGWDDLPSTMTRYSEDETSYYREGVRHRSDGPAVEFKNGDREWWIMGERHRADGPAVQGADGYRAWYIRDQLHREDGPAVIHPDGTLGFYLEGRKLEPTEYAPVERRYRLEHAEEAKALADKRGKEVMSRFSQGTSRDLKPLNPIRFKP